MAIVEVESMVENVIRKLELEEEIPETFLVFKGEKVIYCSYAREILCESRDDCFRITNVDPKDVFGRNVVAIFYAADDVEIIGRELWSDGELWIIKG